MTTAVPSIIFKVWCASWLGPDVAHNGFSGKVEPYEPFAGATQACGYWALPQGYWTVAIVLALCAFVVIGTCYACGVFENEDKMIGALLGSVVASMAWPIGICVLAFLGTWLAAHSVRRVVATRRSRIASERLAAEKRISDEAAKIDHDVEVVQKLIGS